MGLRFKARCDVEECKQEFWADGWEEPDVNAAGINDSDPMEDACQHVIAGGGYTIVDQDYDDDPGWDGEG
jgi:hypothetical protein